MSLCDCTEWYGSEPGSRVWRVLKNLDTHLRMRVVQKKANGVMCISTHLAEYYAGHVATVVVPPLVDVTDAKWGADDGAVGDPDRVVFTYAGSPGSRKDDLSVVFSALLSMDPSLRFTFRILGVSSDDYLSKHPKDAPVVDALGDRVVFLGHRNHVEALSLVRASDWTVFVRRPTRSNTAGFPTKFVESVACSVPVITTRSSDIPSYMDSGVNGFFVGPEPDELALLLKRIIEDGLTVPCRIDPLTFDYHKYIPTLADFMREVG